MYSSAQEVIPRLYIGDSRAAQDMSWLKSTGITHIVNATDEIPNYYTSDFHYLKLGLHDHPTPGKEDLLSRLEPSYKYIESVLRYSPRAKVYVHCHAGVSRSASIVVYYLMRSSKIDFDTAVSLLRKRRNIVRPNPWYTEQLQYASDVLKLL